MNQEEFLKSEMYRDFTALANKYRTRLILTVSTNDKGKCVASFTLHTREENEDIDNRRNRTLELRAEGKTNAEIWNILYPEDNLTDSKSVEWLNSLQGGSTTIVIVKD